MSDSSRPVIGSIGWFDLTVDDAVGIKDFYREVVGWDVEAAAVGDYEDFVMKTASGEAVAGICHARGTNAGLPAQWIAYLTVDDVDASVAKCTEMGGAVEMAARDTGYGRFAVIRDPAGAFVALFAPPKEK